MRTHRIHSLTPVFLCALRVLCGKHVFPVFHFQLGPLSLPQSRDPQAEPNFRTFIVSVVKISRNAVRQLVSFIPAEALYSLSNQAKATSGFSS